MPLSWHICSILFSGSGIKKFPLINLIILPVRLLLSFVAKPADGIFDLSFLYSLNQSVALVL